MFKSKSFKSKLKLLFNNDRGSTLLTVLILLLIFAVIGSVVLVTSANNLYVSQRMSEYEDTYYMAEANAQFALTFLKEEITQYYVSLQKISATKKWEYEKAMEDFYPSIVEKISSNPNHINTKSFQPLDFSDQGVTSTVTITVDVNTPLPTYDYGEAGNTVRFLIESIAESENGRRVVNAVLEVDDPDVNWDITTAPPMTDMRMLIGDEIVLTEDQQQDEYNAIFCRGSAMVGFSFVDQFLENHQEFLNTFTYDYSNSVPTMLEWDLQYDKFPPNEVFSSFEGLFEASTYGSELNDYLYDWQTRDLNNQTVEYTITNYEPATYPNNYIIDSQTNKNDKTLDEYFEMSTMVDTRITNRFVGTAEDPKRFYAVGNVELTGQKNIEHCYIFAEGYVYININGHIKDSIIISNQGYVYIDCDYIQNSTHKLIKAYYNVWMFLDVGAVMKKAVVRSKYGEIYIYNNDRYGYYKKIEMQSCYLYTNPDDRDAQIYLRNVFLNKSYACAGKDLILYNCSGFESSLYAFGTTDENIEDYGRNYLFTRRDYNDYMQYGSYGYFNRWYRGIVVISELPPKAYDVPLYESRYESCDFVTGESIFLSDPYYSNYYGSQLVDLEDCRILADREVLIEDVTMESCFVFAGIRGYEDEQCYYYYNDIPKLYVVRGIYMRVDHTHNRISNCVMYSRGRMMYSQHTPEYNGYNVTVTGKKRVYSSFFYSIGNFEYNGLSTSKGLDMTSMRNNSDLCNDMIIMTESNLGPHEYSPSVANDVVFIGGNMYLDDERPHYSGALEALIGTEAKRGKGDAYDIQCDRLYDNYFEQLLDEEEFERKIPEFGDVFIYEDIYEN